MCNLLEIIQKVKTNGLDALLGFAGVGARELRLLHSKLGPSLEQRQKKELVGFGVSEETAERYRDLMKRLAEWRSLCERQFLSLILDGVREWMLQWAMTDQGERAINTTYEVLSRLNGAFSDRLEFLRRANNEPTPDALVLTTIHASKGREWSAVGVIRAEETVIPDDGSTEAEERRLFYVALTRAKDWLYVSTAKKNPTSRFVIEADLA